jgi:DNA-binding NarL/FixJ family response regulator
VATGLPNAAIASRLDLSVRTVESHVSSLLAKLGAETRVELADAMSTTHADSQN